MAFRIFVHALKMVFSDLWSVVKVSMPVILVLVIGLLLLGSEMAAMTQMMEDPTAMPHAGVYGGFFLFALAYFVATLWMAVAWHRYCLLAEYPGQIMPTFHGGAMLGYFGRAILLGLLGFAGIMVGSIVLGGLAAVGGGAVGAIVSLVGLVGILGLLWALYRLAIILPAAAIGRHLSFADAWAATQPYGVTIIGVFAFLILASLGVGIVTGLFSVILPAAGFIMQVVGNWLMTVLGLSLLTTIYGIAVEGREIE